MKRFFFFTFQNMFDSNSHVVTNFSMPFLMPFSLPHWSPSASNVIQDFTILPSFYSKSSVLWDELITLLQKKTKVHHAWGDNMKGSGVYFSWVSLKSSLHISPQIMWTFTCWWIYEVEIHLKSWVVWKLSFSTDKKISLHIFNYVHC